MNLKEVIPKILFESLKSDSIVSDVTITTSFRLSEFSEYEVNFSILIQDSVIPDLDISRTLFTQKVKIANSKIDSIEGYSCYFTAGFELINCEISGNVDFSCGGHTEDGTIFLIKNCIFHESVTFFDSFFDGFVIIEDNDFKKGTDLLFTGHAQTTVDFRKGHRISGNIGELDKEIVVRFQS
jgi:hypothetical protein